MSHDEHLIDAVRYAGYEDLLKAMSGIERRRLLYGEWVQDECVDCKSLENVHLYRQRGTRSNITVHLCDTCYAFVAHYGIYKRQWEPEDK